MVFNTEPTLINAREEALFLLNEFSDHFMPKNKWCSVCDAKIKSGDVFKIHLLSETHAKGKFVTHNKCEKTIDELAKKNKLSFYTILGQLIDIKKVVPI